MTSKSTLPVLVTTAALVIIPGTVIAFAVAPVATEQGFDHSVCQYPDRWSNPDDGCDNSDPAVPECIKSMATEYQEQQCILEFLNLRVSDTTSSEKTAPEASQEVDFEDLLQFTGGK